MKERFVVKGVIVHAKEKTLATNKILFQLQLNCFDTKLTPVTRHVNRGYCCFSFKCLFACANWLSARISREYAAGPFMLVFFSNDKSLQTETHPQLYLQTESMQAFHQLKSIYKFAYQFFHPAVLEEKFSLSCFYSCLYQKMLTKLQFPSKQELLRIHKS